MTTTILTDEQIYKFARAIEQAVLQSPGVQAMRKDLEEYVGIASELATESEALMDALSLVVDLASQEWQEADGQRKAASDNQGRRFWFITEDVMQAVRAAMEKQP